MLQRYDFCVKVIEGVASQEGEFVKADEALAEIARLRELVEKLKNCSNCKHDKDFECDGCVEGYTKWEAK